MPTRIFPVRHAALAALLAAAVGACDDAPTASAPPPPPSSTAVARWHEVARALVVKHRPNNPAAFRLFAYLALAQHAAVAAAEARDAGAVPGAIARASATVLAHVFPADAAALDSVVRAEERLAAARATPTRSPASTFAAGEAVGREAADAVVARAASDRFDATFTGAIPTGPGAWVATAPPLLPALGQMRPFVLGSGSQLRPPPPPAFGSPAFVAALAEVRQAARSRTPEQLRLAQDWALPGGTVLPAGYWNREAVALAARHALGERATAHVLALAHAALMDATIAVHDAKYTYWYVRPSQADPTIPLGVGLPSHPSYPSNHTAASVAAAHVLGAFFPADSARLDALAAEAGLSRLHGGIHYRFDIDAGATLGHAVARATLALGRHTGVAALAR